MKIVAHAYVIIGLLACTMPWLNIHGILGQPDPLSGMFPLFVALPWSMLLNYLPGDPQSVLLPTLVCATGVLINYGALLWIAAHVGRR